MDEAQKPISNIGYIVSNQKMKDKITKIIIDDKALNWNTGSDHSWIEVATKLHSHKFEDRENDKNKTKTNLNITPKTNWGSFRKKLIKALIL